jgi:hypothetical protein
MIKNIAVRTTDYTIINVDAEIYGKFAVHPSIIPSKLWTVTLISVGLSVAKGLKKKIAINLAKELDALDTQWPAKYKKGLGTVKTKLLTKSYNTAKPIIEKYRQL